jgi:Flp pilus assembly protein TadD
VPAEAAVHVLMGKVYEKLGENNNALRALMSALDLNPKDKQVRGSFVCVCG